MSKCVWARWAFPAVIVLAVAGRAPSENSSENVVSGDLIVFHAGSLAVPFKEIAQGFEKENPKVDVVCEAAGSRDCARKVAELGLPCDVVAVSDYSVVQELLVPDHAEWVIPFAANEMAIVYTDSSRGANEITRDNWHEVLLRDDVAFGRSDPESDPCGYRAIFTVKLAEKHYQRPGLAELILAKDRKYIRPKEVDLLGLLEAGEIDYVFLYRSVAVQHGLKCVLLPDEINLGNPRMAKGYSAASVELTGKKPGEKVVHVAEPIVYGITIPKKAPNPEAAVAFVRFVLSPDKGMAIMKKHGQTSVVPSPAGGFDKIPAELKAFAIDGAGAAP